MLVAPFCAVFLRCFALVRNAERSLEHNVHLRLPRTRHAASLDALRELQHAAMHSSC